MSTLNLIKNILWHQPLAAALKYSVVAAIILTGLETASAQLLIDPVGDYFRRTTLFNSIMGNQMALKMIQENQRRQAGKARSSTAKVGSSSTNAVSTPLKASPTVFKFGSAYMIPSILAKNPGMEKAAPNFSALIDLYRETAKKDGFPENDLAYAFEYLIVNNYLIHQQLIDVPYEKDPLIKNEENSFRRLELRSWRQAHKILLFEERAVYNQFKEILEANPEVAKLSDSQKQQLVELIAIKTNFNFKMYLDKGVMEENDSIINQARLSAKSDLEKLLGVSIDKVSITKNGVEIK